jgi:hypothetical protein
MIWQISPKYQWNAWSSLLFTWQPVPTVPSLEHLLDIVAPYRKIL